jgi:NAD(P)-dependent dehydrogenase (short-subunit alcohol dehydrogenase family)
MTTSDQGKPAQTQETQPGLEHKMHPEPEYIKKDYKGSELLKNKVAIVTGGDSGIGRAVSVAFATEGADVVISYLEESQDAEKTKALVESLGRKAILVKGDISQKDHCQKVVDQAIEAFSKVDILVNNAAKQFPESSFEEITESQLRETFETNIFSYFYLALAVLPHLKEGSVIINTSSVTAYRGSEHLVDYSSTKGAIVSFTRSLALNLADKKIRVNGVAPGPIWTPLIPATFSREHVEKFGLDVPLGRPGEPSEVAPCYVFLASDLSSYMTGQFLHPNGGEIVNT